MNKVTCSHSITINKSQEEVWDYTQNWNNRSQWDFSIKSAEYLSQSSPIVVHAKGRGGLSFKVTYKVSDRPRLTTLVMTDLNSFWIKGGGGSWKYEGEQSSTKWTQHNTLILRDGFLGRLVKPFFLFGLSWTTRKIMKRAQAIVNSLENEF